MAIFFNNNKLYGELSEKWGQCHNLTRLNISNNKISGTLPNHLVRKIPKELGQLKILFNLKLNNTSLIQ